MNDTFLEFRRALEGTVCRGLVAQAYGYQGELVAPVSVLYVAFAEGRWARFGIDAGAFHWRETPTLESIPGDGSGNTYPLVDLATTYPVVGRRLGTIEFTRTSPDDVQLTLAFDQGGVIALVNRNDYSSLDFLAPAV